MGEKLGQPGFVDQESPGPQDPRDLGKPGLRVGDVVAGPEVEHPVEACVLEGHAPDVAVVQISRHSVRVEMTAGIAEESWVEVEAHQPPGRASLAQGDERIPGAAADLEQA
jgi:hypothetical protein